MSARLLASIAAAAVATALTTVACYRSYKVEGRLVASDGAIGTRCEVTVGDAYTSEGAGYECFSPEIPPRDIDGPWIVLTGSRFSCQVSYGAGDDELRLRVRCPGYAPVDHRFAGCNSGCEDIDLGTILVEPR